MSGSSSIEWTDATWNLMAGCTRVSEGCRHCYAELLAATRLRSTRKYDGAATMTESGPRWSGSLRFSAAALEEPLRWRAPRRVFVNSMSDTFHELAQLEWLDRTFAVMALARRHTFQVLTKRPERAAAYLNDPLTPGRVARLRGQFRFVDRATTLGWPLPNVWVGTSVEAQGVVGRVAALLEADAAVRFVSAEPLLGPLWLDGSTAAGLGYRWDFLRGELPEGGRRTARLDWVIAGGESGREARPMRPSWARSLRDQCVGAGVAFFFKQWGEWVGGEYFPPGKLTDNRVTMTDGRQCEVVDFGAGEFVARVGKRAAGRLLDGRKWEEMPRCSP